MDQVVKRRDFIRIALISALTTPLVCTVAVGQLIPFELSLRRDRDLPTTLDINDCILGKLYLGPGSLSDPGQFLCDTLELPFKNELSYISCVKAGRYSASVKTGPTAEGVILGWRLQLADTTQTAIQIHTGNTLRNTHRCILVGARSDSPCELTGGTSVPPRDKIKSLYGDNNSRLASLTVMN
jgi:Family of unknown function (DUF5675)